MDPAASPTSRETGRLGAYVIRNRRHLTQAAEQILATEGPSASIKQFADAAEMSVGSIYQHFGSKEGLIEAAVADALAEWNRWVQLVLAEVDDDLERLVFPMRFITRLSSTHPSYAAMFTNCSEVITRLFLHLEPSDPFSIVNSLVAAGRIPDIDIELRTRTVLFSVAMLALVGFTSSYIDLAEADQSIGLIIGMLGVSPDDADRLIRLPLPDPGDGLAPQTD